MVAIVALEDGQLIPQPIGDGEQPLPLLGKYLCELPKSSFIATRKAPNIRCNGWFDGVYPEFTDWLTTGCGCAGVSMPISTDL